MIDDDVLIQGFADDPNTAIERAIEAGIEYHTAALEAIVAFRQQIAEKPS